MQHGEVLDKILSQKNLNDAYLQVKRNKGVAGVDGLSIDEAQKYLKVHREELISAIQTRTYNPQPVLRVEIPKANGGIRLLGIPTVIDRIFQQAIAQVMSPMFDRDFHENSFGFRPQKSAQMAILKSLEYMNEGYDWVVDLDLERFFDTVHHDRLMNLVSRTVKDGDVISLIRKYLVSGVQIEGKVEKTRIGTPQGGNLSPLLSNIMLNELDQELERRGLRFVRYADDCIILVKSEFAARRVMQSVTRYIEEVLGLIVNASKSKITKPNDKEMKFLGFGYYWDWQSKSYKVKPHQASIDKFKYTLHQLSRKTWSVDMDYRIQRLNWVIRGWVNYFKIGSMKNALKAISGHLRFRLRMCIWHQWKKAKKRIKSLIQLGMNKYNAYKYGHSSKGTARIASSWVMATTVTNKRLAQKGLISPDSYYLGQRM